ARGWDGRKFPWGDEFDARRCHINGPGPVSGLHYGGPVRENEDDLRDISYFGVFNMAGNVSEWVDSGTPRTKYIMGGDYASVAWYHTLTWNRLAYPPSFRAQFVGFRVVKEYD
ncbi:MAG: SUMF1/EgtB/PvdO family nonheme iron enzyme, partial [Phycisphaeraceae bacterium]|nr:SUMF1/EgtB/PvdO family nonheme iron enzyme [Phycisphaeraceae bacterium]